MEISHIKDLTPYMDVNEIIATLTQEVHGILGDELVGLYLMGSLTYDDFNPERSDIDLLVATKSALSKEKLDEIEAMHARTGEANEKWTKRIECSYVPIEMLENILPPKTPRPYIGEGVFYTKAPYGNEWLINQYLLYKHGIPLVGPDFKELVNPIDIKEVQKACVRDLFQEWEPKIKDSKYLQNSHYQSYVVLNLCRILYTVMCGEVVSKKVSSSWAKEEFGSEWGDLIQTAENWQYGTEMKLQDQTVDFIKFVISKVKEKHF